VTQPNALVEGRGNFGSPFGHPAAAERYTEVKSSPVFEHLLDPHMMDVGNFVKNYDESDIEPTVFPTKLPLILLTGVSGIGVGFATNYPALHVSTVKQIVKSGIECLDDYKAELDYAYQACLLGNHTYPKHEVLVDPKSGREYLSITEVPIGSSLAFIQSEFITDLVSSNNIKVINSSTIGAVNVRVEAPHEIQTMILKSISSPINRNLSYYWDRYRTSDFLKWWMMDKLAYVTRREYFKQSKEWNKDIVHECVNAVATTLKSTPGAIDNIGALIDGVVTSKHSKAAAGLPVEAVPYVHSVEKLKDLIASKPISALKITPPKPISAITSLSSQDILQIVYSEAESVDEKLFSRKSVKISTSTTAQFVGNVVRYISYKNEEVIVSFRPTQRAVNHTIGSTDMAYVVYSDGSIAEVAKWKAGVYRTTPEKKVVGFGIAGTLLVVLTESQSVHVVAKLGYIKEPIAYVSTANVMEIDGVSYPVTSGIKFTNVKSLKIIN